MTLVELEDQSFVTAMVVSDQDSPHTVDAKTTTFRLSTVPDEQDAASSPEDVVDVNRKFAPAWFQAFRDSRAARFHLSAPVASTISTGIAVDDHTAPHRTHDRPSMMKPSTTARTMPKPTNRRNRDDQAPGRNAVTAPLGSRP